MSKTVFVCGHGRCGSSLVMQMLQAGGYPVFGDYPAFEPSEVGFSRTEDALRPLVHGKAVKVLDPQITAWSDLHGVLAIWLYRDRNQQARSQVKFLRAIAGIEIPSNAWKAIASSYWADTAAAVRSLEGAGATVKRLSFENILDNPAASAKLIAEWVDQPMNLQAMAAQVIRRPPRCEPGMEIEMSLIAKRTPPTATDATDSAQPEPPER